MSQGVLGFKYEEEKHDTGMTGLAGLPVYLDLMKAMGLQEQIGQHLQVKQRGWTDAQMVSSLIMLNLAGGDCVEDLERVQKDEGFCRILRRIEQQGIRRAERREIERRWRKERDSKVYLLMGAQFGCWAGLVIAACILFGCGKLVIGFLCLLGAQLFPQGRRIRGSSCTTSQEQTA